MNNTLLVQVQRCIVPLALIACSGSDPSELFLSPSNATMEPSSAAPTTDAGIPGTPGSADSGVVDASSPPSSLDSGPAVDASGWAADAPDSGLPVDQPNDSGPAPTVCPLAGEAVTTIDDGSWPGANASILPQCGRTGAWYVFNDGASDQSPNAAGPFGPSGRASLKGGILQDAFRSVASFRRCHHRLWLR